MRYGYFMASKGIIGIGVIVVIIIIAGAFLLLSNKSGSNTTTTAVSNSNGSAVKSTVITVKPTNATTTSAVNTSSNTSTVSTSSNSVYLSQSQIQSLLGVEGNYSITSYVGAAFAAKLNESKANTTSTANYTYLQNGTGEWGVVYENTTSHVAFLEELIKSTTPKIGLKFFQSTGIKFNVTNATLNGLTYNFESTGAPFNSTGLLGYKGDYMAYVVVVGKQIPQTELTSVIASDIPS